VSRRTRARSLKAAAGVHTVHIPHQRGRRGAPFVVVLPETPSLTREALSALGGLLWRSRGALAPTGLALLAVPLTWALHAIAWWSGLLLAPLAVVPLLWLAVMQHRCPAQGTVLAWRTGLAVLAALADAWVALAAGFGPLAGPLELLWLLTWLSAQTAWLIVRRTH